MRELSLTEFIAYVQSSGYGEVRHYRNLVKAIQMSGVDLKEGVFYPKNFMLEDKNLIVYVFNENEVFRFEDLDKKVITTVFKTNQIINIQMIVEKEDFPEPQIKINLSAGEEIILKGYDDTRGNWAEELSKKALMIFKMLS